MLSVIVTVAHQNIGIFPTFPQETEVVVKQSCDKFVDWYLCEILGYTTYISRYLLKDNRLLIDYNPTELDVEINEELEVVAIYGAWLYARDSKRVKCGWIPAEKVTSLH